MIMEPIFLRHFARYPKMQPQDGVKLAYQSAFGGGHLLSEPEAARSRLREEAQGLTPEPGIQLLEELGGGYHRLHLNSSECNAISLDTVFFLFQESAARFSGSRPGFEDAIATLKALTASGKAPFSSEALGAYLAEYEAAGRPQPRHSQAYRTAYQPAYRVIASGLSAFLPLFRAIDGLLGEKKGVTVAIDGMSAAGKSTLGALLQKRYGCTLIHMDDFFLPKELRTPARLATPGGNVHYERFQEQVLTGLASKGPFQYDVFDCHAMAYTRRETVAPNRLTIVEGAYALHPSLRKAYDLKVFYPVDPAKQLERIRRRNGEGCVPAFQTKWIPLENAYIQACGVKDCCDITL